MGDIVERLRNVFPLGFEGEMRHEAAAEIERLRAERDRLRKALDKIQTLGLGPDRGSAQWQIDTAREISRAALKEDRP